MSHKKTNKQIFLVIMLVFAAAIIAILLLTNPQETPVTPAVITNTPISFSNTSANESASMPDTITVEEAAKKLENGAYLIDVREQSEWETGHISGAVLIPLGKLPNRLSEIPTDREVMLICRSGKRSAQALEILRSAGLENTTSIAGGMNEWAASGLPVTTEP